MDLPLINSYMVSPLSVPKALDPYYELMCFTESILPNYDHATTS